LVVESASQSENERSPLETSHKNERGITQEQEEHKHDGYDCLLRAFIFIEGHGYQMGFFVRIADYSIVS
jgi:hypothetical protein